MSCPREILKDLDGGLVEAGQSWHPGRSSGEVTAWEIINLACRNIVLL